MVRVLTTHKAAEAAKTDAANQECRCKTYLLFVTQSELWAHLLERIVAVDLFCFHSFKRGGPTTAHLGQISERQIMVRGRLCSDCMCEDSYLSAQDEANLGVVTEIRQIPA